MLLALSAISLKKIGYHVAIKWTKVLKVLNQWRIERNDREAVLKENYSGEPLINESAPVAQLIEHRSVTREVVSSTPVGPTLRVLK